MHIFFVKQLVRQRVTLRSRDRAAMQPMNGDSADADLATAVEVHGGRIWVECPLVRDRSALW